MPDRDFAVASLCNAGPEGIACNQAIVRWALEEYLGLIDRDPEPVPYDDVYADQLVASYETDAMDLTVR